MRGGVAEIASFAAYSSLAIAYTWSSGAAVHDGELLPEEEHRAPHTVATVWLPCLGNHGFIVALPGLRGALRHNAWASQQGGEGKD